MTVSSSALRQDALTADPTAHKPDWFHYLVHAGMIVGLLAFAYWVGPVVILRPSQPAYAMVTHR